MYKYLLVICLLAGCVFAAAAQNSDTSSSALKIKTDSVKSKKRDTIPVKKAALPKIKKEKVYHPDSTHSPHKAVMHSLIIPGWGQIYNHRWWKVPVIYGGIGLLGWAIVFNEQYYKQYLTIAQYNEHGIVPKPTDKYYNEYNLYKGQPQAVINATDSYRRDRDLSILGIFAAWGINAIDAYIDAKFIHSYTIDNNLSMNISPGLINQQAYAQNLSSPYIPGIKITFTLK